MHSKIEMSDEDLILSSRAGDRAALETLYNRHHDAGLRFARRLMRNRADAEDVAQEAFLKVVAALERGNGPKEMFRPYLLTAVRTAAVDRWEEQAKETPTEDTGETPVEDPSLASLMHRDDPELVMKAFQSLPLRWMTVLWHAEVEREPPRRIAPVLGIEPGAVSALLLRARKGLREAYLRAYTATPPHDECEPTFPYLAATVLGTGSARDRRKVQEHTRECEDCAKVLAELTDVGATMRGVLAPLILVALPAAIGGLRLPMHTRARWATLTAAASVVAVAVGAVAAVGMAGGFTLGGGPTVPTPTAPAWSRSLPSNPTAAGPPLGNPQAIPHPKGPAPQEAFRAVQDYQAIAIIPPGGFAGTVPGTTVSPVHPASAARPPAGAGPSHDPAIHDPTATDSVPTMAPVPTASPVPTPTTPPAPTLTPMPTLPAPTPPSPPVEPVCTVILILCIGG